MRAIRRGAFWDCWRCASACPISRWRQRRPCCRAGWRISSPSSTPRGSSPPPISASFAGPALLSVRLRAVAVEHSSRRAGGPGPTCSMRRCLLLCGLLTMRRARAKSNRLRPSSARAHGDNGDPLLLWIALLGARVGPVARDHQCDHAMVGGGAVPVDRAAQPLSADLRHRLRPSAPLSPAAVRCGIPAAGRHDLPPALPESSRISSRSWRCRRRRCSQAA